MIPNLYTIECPSCKVLEKKLIAKNIPFNKVTEFDAEQFIQSGNTNMPKLEVSPGNFLEYKEAINWVNNN